MKMFKDFKLNFVAQGPINNIPALVQKMPCLAPNRRQVIIWTNDGLFTDVCMRHSASVTQ